MANIALSGLSGIFGDQVYSSTDLNRRAGDVLNRALKGPVTISRNGEQFALLKREQAAELSKVASQFGMMLDLMDGALAVAEDDDPPNSLRWLKAFAPDDIRKMIREVVDACGTALHETGDWDSVNTIVHEWHESALVELSGVLKEAMSSPSEKIPLPDPIGASSS